MTKSSTQMNHNDKLTLQTNRKCYNHFISNMGTLSTTDKTSPIQFLLLKSTLWDKSYDYHLHSYHLLIPQLKGIIHPTKFITTRCRMVLAKRKSAKARSGEMPWKSALFCGLICILRQTI